MLTMDVSIASCERSFSKLKLVLSYLRASMTRISQVRLCDLTLISIERGILCDLTEKAGCIYVSMELCFSNTIGT